MPKNDYGMLLAVHRKEARKLRLSNSLWLDAGAFASSFFRLGVLAVTLALLSVSYADTFHVRRSCAQYELRMLTGLIEHHQFASELASLGITRAVHPELQTLCIFNTWSLRSEIGDHRRLLADWFENNYEPRATRREERTIARLAALSGEEFEIALMTELIKLDTSALRLGRLCERRAGHSELVGMWGGIGQAMQSEIAQLRNWLCEWHSRCAGNTP